MKHIKWDFSLKAWVQSPWVEGWDRGQNQTFSEYGHVPYQIKADDTCSNMVANILPRDTPLTWGEGSKGHVAYKIKGN